VQATRRRSTFCPLAEVWAMMATQDFKEKLARINRTKRTCSHPLGMHFPELTLSGGRTCKGSHIHQADERRKTCSWKTMNSPSFALFTRPPRVSTPKSKLQQATQVHRNKTMQKVLCTLTS
jgi:hypothetical protein